MTCGRAYGYHAFYPFFGEASTESSSSGSDRDRPLPTGATGWGHGWGPSWRHRKYKGHCGGRPFERRIPIDVTEARDSLQIIADVPGASKDAINIEAEKGLLTISVAALKSAKTTSPASSPAAAATADSSGPLSGPPQPIGTLAGSPPQPPATAAGAVASTGAPPGTPSHRVILQQRPTSFAKRTVELPEAADGLRAEASCTDGVLTITVPKEVVPETKTRVPIV